MADVMQPPKGGEPDTPEQKKPVPLVNDGLSPSDVDFIPPLVHSLVTLLRLRGKSVSTAFLMAGLAGTGRVSPGACLHAAKRAGLEGKIVYRKSLQDISTLVLPCILLLSRDRSCVLTSLDDGKAEVIFPETGEGVQPVPLQMLADEYTGYAIFATREARLDQRADRIRLLKGKRWFWDVLLYYMPIYRHVAFASVVINLIGVISPLFVMNVYDRVIPNNAVDTLWVLAIGILIAYLFDFLLRNLRSYFVDVAAFQPSGAESADHAAGRQARIDRRAGQQPARIRVVARIFQLLDASGVHRPAVPCGGFAPAGIYRRPAGDSAAVRHSRAHHYGHRAAGGRQAHGGAGL